MKLKNYVWEYSFACRVGDPRFYWEFEEPGTNSPNRGKLETTVEVTTNTGNKRVSQLVFRLVRLADDSVVATAVSNLYIEPNCPILDKTRANLAFGQMAGISWTDTAIVPLPGIIPENTIDTLPNLAGGVSCNDASGKLRFYAKRDGIWNASQQKVLGGLFADSTSSQHGVAIQAPGDTSKAWLFTVPGYNTTNFTNKGLRWHRLHLANIQSNDTAGSTINQRIKPPTAASVYTTNDSSSKVADKIAMITKCNGNGYWLVVQGAWGSSDSAKFYVFDVSQAGIQALDTVFNAKWASRNGQIKFSAQGNLLVCTYSNINPETGSGTGKNAWLFGFDRATGYITPLKELKPMDTQCGTNNLKLASFGAEFDKNGNYVYVNVNQQNCNNPTAGTPKVFAGLYRFATASIYTSSTDTTIEGERLSYFYRGTSASVDILRGADQKLYISNTFDPKVYNECKTYGFRFQSTYYHKSGKRLGVVHFPEMLNCGLNLDGPAITTITYPVGSNVLSRGYLGTFPVTLPAVSDTGTTLAKAIDLGVNPRACCGTLTHTLDVACAGNEGGELGNDVYFKFMLKKHCGLWPTLQINSSESVDSIKTTLFAYDGTTWNPLVPNCLISNNCSITDSDFSQILEFPYLADSAQIRIVIDAKIEHSAGNFVLKISAVQQSGSDPACSDEFNSCCRIAVDSIVFDEQVAQRSTIDLFDFKLIPNPASRSVDVEMNSTDTVATDFQLIDLTGKQLKKYLLEQSRTRIDLEGLNSGLYWIRLQQGGKIKVRKLIVSK